MNVYEKTKLKREKDAGAPGEDHVSPQGGEVIPNSGRVRLHTFSFTHKRVKTGVAKALRFSMLITYDHPEYGRLAIDIEGCRATIEWDEDSKSNKLKWHPPLFRSGAYWRNNVFCSNDLEKLVTAALSKTKFVDQLKDSFTSFLDNELKSKKATEYDPSLPEELDL